MSESTENPFQSPQAVDTDANLPEVAPPYVFAGVNTPSDFAKSARFSGNNPRAFWILTLASGFFVLLFGVSRLNRFGNDADAVVWIVLGVSLLSSVLIPKVINFIWYKLYLVNFVGYHGEQTHIIDDVGLHFVAAESEQIVKWKGIVCFRGSDDILILYARFPRHYYAFFRKHLQTVDAWPSLLRFVAERLPEE